MSTSKWLAPRLSGRPQPQAGFLPEITTICGSRESLRCLTVLGLEAEAKAFLECLSEIYEDEQNKPTPAISDETMLCWRDAIGDAGRR